MNNYVDLVVAQKYECNPCVFIFPAWSPVRPNDVILDNDESSYTVLCKTTVEPHDDVYDVILAAAEQKEPLKATAYYRRNDVVWENDNDEPVSE